MGLLDVFSLTSQITAAEPRTVTAAVNVLPSQNFQPLFMSPFTTRQEAMEVPAVARARSIICGTAASLPLKAFNKINGAQIEGRTILTQPDPALPTAVTMSYTFDDLLFHDVAYWSVLEVSPDDGRPTRARRIDPLRVSYQTDGLTGIIIDGFYVDGNLVPMSGVGSLIVFYGLGTGGILTRAGRTIKTALDLEKAVSRMAEEPAPAMYIKNSGVDLPAAQVSSLLANWKAARMQRSTAYLSGNLEVQAFGFDATQMELSANRMNTATEIARLMNIPAWYLNAESTSSTYSNTLQERRSLIDLSLMPYLIAVEGRLSMDDITPMTQHVRFEVEEYLRGTAIERVEVTARMLELGLIDVEEARAMEGLAPRGSDSNSSNEIANARELNIAEVVQKVYLGVDKVITSDEARQIVNEAGGNLTIPGPEFMPATTTTESETNAN
jgi:HK97 family phage portal protein